MSNAEQTIPLTPVPVSSGIAEQMLQRQIKKHHVAIILLHWFNAITWLFELITGAALISSPNYRFVPEWFIVIVQDIFGSRPNMLRFHIALGLTWTGVFLVYGIFGFRAYLGREVMEREIALDRDDFRWLIVRTLRLLGRTNEELPPQGSYNAGQKLFALLVYSMIPLIMVSGLVMAFHPFGAAATGWAIVLHFAAVSLVVSGLMVHVYMGAVFPEEKPAFFSMITGTVNELYAYNHHFKWWREVKMSQQAWELKHDHADSGVAESGVTAAGVETQSLWQRAFRSEAYWPPYVAGTGLGLALLATFVVMGDGLGASGGFTRYLAAALQWLSPSYVASNPYWSIYADGGQSPLINFLVFELVGVAIGGFVSGWLAHRVRFAVDKGPRISRGTRYGLALGGGILTGIGARLARGCTSGLALSGGAVLSVGAFIFMLSVFAAGFVGAYFLRRKWL
jgi:formate dehydrogenase gamma subunit